VTFIGLAVIRESHDTSKYNALVKYESDCRIFMELESWTRVSCSGSELWLPAVH
jgi:hypothetical protein